MSLAWPLCPAIPTRWPHPSKDPSRSDGRKPQPRPEQQRSAIHPTQSLPSHPVQTYELSQRLSIRAGFPSPIQIRRRPRDFVRQAAGEVGSKIASARGLTGFWPTVRRSSIRMPYSSNSGTRIWSCLPPPESQGPEGLDG